MINPSKYFTNKDVRVNMPIIPNCFFKFSERAISFSNFSNRQFQWSKCQCIILVWVKIILKICNDVSYLSGTFFLYAVFYGNQMCDPSLFLASTSGTSPPPRIHHFGRFMWLCHRNRPTKPCRFQFFRVWRRPIQNILLLKLWKPWIWNILGLLCFY